MKNLLSKFEQPTRDFIINLREGWGMILFDRKTKLFHSFDLNKTSKRICWTRYVSKDRRNWIKWNECLSLSEILDCRAEIAIHCQEMCFKQTA